jgi:hypothetical protein
VIGASDYIGAAIARRFAAEGFTISAGRRHGDKLTPLAWEIEAQPDMHLARPLDAREEDQVNAFVHNAVREESLELCVLDVSANVNYPILKHSCDSLAVIEKGAARKGPQQPTRATVRTKS